LGASVADGPFLKSGLCAIFMLLFFAEYQDLRKAKPPRFFLKFAQTDSAN
jgi:hypothetical protein